LPQDIFFWEKIRETVKENEQIHSFFSLNQRFWTYKTLTQEMAAPWFLLASLCDYIVLRIAVHFLIKSINWLTNLTICSTCLLVFLLCRKDIYNYWTWKVNSLIIWKILAWITLYIMSKYNELIAYIYVYTKSIIMGFKQKIAIGPYVVHMFETLQRMNINTWIIYFPN